MHFYIQMNDLGSITRVFESGTGERPIPSSYYSVPSDWGMYTKAGNRSIRFKAETFVQKLALGMPAFAAARTFLRSYVRLYKSATMSEAMDTAVRESVYCFLFRFDPIIDIEKLEDLWDREVE